MKYRHLPKGGFNIREIKVTCWQAGEETELKFRKGFSFVHLIPRCESWDSAVSTTAGYGLHDGGVGVRLSAGSRVLSSPRRLDRSYNFSLLTVNSGRKTQLLFS
jgi:hypothetical protein